MSQVATRAGVSRQALYLHFADRTTLLLEASRLADRKYRTPDRQRRIDEAPSGREALRKAVALQAHIKPLLLPMIIALGVLRRSDAAAEIAWQERDQARLERCRQVADRLENESLLRPGLSTDAAAAMIWVATSSAAWEDLVLSCGWTAQRWTDETVALLEAGLLRSDA